MDVTIDTILRQIEGFRATQSAVIGAQGFLALIALSLVATLFISALYLVFFQSRAAGTNIHRSFPLLGIGITTLFISIQFSLPLSLGLLGALSIVRFRTPIKEPEEIGFVMLVIAASIACATGNVKFLAILLAFAVVALLIQRYALGLWKGPLHEGFVSVTVPNDKYKEVNAAVKALFKQTLRSARLHSVTRSDDVTTIAYSFNRISQTQLAALEDGFGAMAGPSDYNIMLNRQASL